METQYEKERKVVNLSLSESRCLVSIVASLFLLEEIPDWSTVLEFVV